MRVEILDPDYKPIKKPKNWLVVVSEFLICLAILILMAIFAIFTLCWVTIFPVVGLLYFMGFMK